VQPGEPCRDWIFVTLLLVIGTAVSSTLAAVTLEALMQRPSGGGSMTRVVLALSVPRAWVRSGHVGAGLSHAAESCALMNVQHSVRTELAQENIFWRANKTAEST